MDGETNGSVQSINNIVTYVTITLLHYTSTIFLSFQI